MSLLSEPLEDRTLLVPSLSIVDTTFVEGDDYDQPYFDGSHNVRIDFSEPATEAFTIYFGYDDGTAQSVTTPFDHSGVYAGVYVTVGQTFTATAAFIHGDLTPEDDEYYFIKITGVSSATAASIADDTATITILDDDGPDMPVISIDDVGLMEGNSGSTTYAFQVTLSNSSTNTVTVNYATADGSATAASDYAATSGMVTFSPGSTSQTVTVSVQGDTDFEPSEWFLVNLSSPTNATIGDGQGSGLIGNDDLPPSTGAAPPDVLRPEDGDNPQSYPNEDDCECECVGGTPAPENQLLDGYSLQHSNRAANPQVSHLFETIVSPSAVSSSTASPTQQLVQLQIRNRPGLVGGGERCQGKGVRSGKAGKGVSDGLKNDQ